MFKGGGNVGNWEYSVDEDRLMAWGSHIGLVSPLFHGYE